MTSWVSLYINLYLNLILWIYFYEWITEWKSWSLFFNYELWIMNNYELHNYELFNYESMITQTWKIYTVTYSSTIYYNYFLCKFRFLVGVSMSNSQKLIEWIYREVEGYSRPKRHYEPIHHN